MKKLPPIEKVYEAWTALADERVKLNDGYADVASSDGEKSYIVRFFGNQFSSDDNATYWQGYPGYPVIAVMMLLGRLPYDKEEAELWKNINWTRLNKEYKNNYAKAVKYVESERNIDPEISREKALKVLEKLEVSGIEIKRKIKDPSGNQRI